MCVIFSTNQLHFYFIYLFSLHKYDVTLQTTSFSIKYYLIVAFSAYILSFPFIVLCVFFFKDHSCLVKSFDWHMSKCLRNLSGYDLERHLPTICIKQHLSFYLKVCSNLWLLFFKITEKPREKFQKTLLRCD